MGGGGGARAQRRKTWLRCCQVLRLFLFFLLSVVFVLLGVGSGEREAITFGALPIF